MGLSGPARYCHGLVHIATGQAAMERAARDVGPALQVHVGEAYYLGSKGMDRDSAEAFRWLSRYPLSYQTPHLAGLRAASCSSLAP